MISGHFGYVLSGSTDLCKETIYGVPSVKELPEEDAGRVQAKTTARIRVKEHGPIVKLLPEQDKWVDYGFLTVFHGSTLSLSLNISRQSNTDRKDPTVYCNISAKVPRCFALV